MIAEPVRLGHLHLAAETAEARRDALERGGHLGVDGHPVERREHRDAEAREPIAACRRNRDLPRDVLADLGARRHVERQLEVLGGARHRALHAHHDRGVRHRRHRELSAPRHRRLARAVTVDAAEGGRHADRAADVAPEFQGREPGRERGRAAPGRAAGRAAEIPGIVGPPVHRIVRLPVGKHLGHVRLRHDDGARALLARRDRRVVLRPKVLPREHAGGGAQPADVDGFLQGHRQAEQRSVLAARASRVGGLGVAARPLEVGLDDRVQLGIVPFDSPPVQIEKVNGRHSAGAQRGEHLGRGREGVDPVTHVSIPLTRSGEPTLPPPPGRVKDSRLRARAWQRSRARS